MRANLKLYDISRAHKEFQKRGYKFDKKRYEGSVLYEIWVRESPPDSFAIEPPTIVGPNLKPHYIGKAVLGFISSDSIEPTTPPKPGYDSTAVESILKKIDG